MFKNRGLIFIATLSLLVMAALLHRSSGFMGVTTTRVLNAPAVRGSTGHSRSTRTSMSWRNVGALSMSTESTGKVGFIGLGIMGTGMAQNLIKGGKELVVWNRSAEKAKEFAAKNAGKCTVAFSPKEVVLQSDIIFSMLSVPEAAQAVFYGDEGVLEGVTQSNTCKKIVDMATYTVEDMQLMYYSTLEAGGEFLEAPVSGSKVPAEQGSLVFMCGGSESLYTEVKEELKLMGKADLFLGEAGKGTEMKLVVNMVMGTMLASLAEGMCLSDSLGLDNSKLLEILSLGAMANPMFAMKGPLMMKKNYATNFPLKHAQKDMRFALALGDEVGQPLPLAAVANAEYKRARGLHGDDDFCAVIEALRSRPT